jgi:Ser-tRNA(Ala) deacylase AlaX
VLFTSRESDRLLVVSDATPAHPVSFRWPDQPSDTGSLAWSGTSRRMNEALTGLADSETGELHIGEDAKALGQPGQAWVGVVVHVLDADAEIPAVGSEVDIDADRRGKLSAAHTAAHLSAFALNRALTPFWTKQGVAVDSMGSADFDKEAMVSLRLSYEGATDIYRLGTYGRRVSTRKPQSPTRSTRHSQRGWPTWPRLRSIPPTRSSTPGASGDACLTAARRRCSARERMWPISPRLRKPA